MDWEIVGPIEQIEVIAAGPSIRDLAELRRRFGRGRWRKMKGVAQIQYSSGTIRVAELHWYEAHGIGKRLMKKKRNLDE